MTGLLFRIPLASVFSGHLLCSVANVIFAQEFTVLETARPGPPGPVGGIAINNVQFLGARFTLASETTLSSVGGHFSAGQNGAPGPIFAAIARLGSSDAFPNGAPFDSSEVLKTALVQIPSGPQASSEEILIPMPITLPNGNYMIVFGSGLFGATGEAGITTVNPTLGVTSFPVFINNFSFTGWRNAELTAIGDPGKTIRIVVTAVPETSSLNLFILSAFLVGTFRRSKESNRFP